MTGANGPGRHAGRARLLRHCKGGAHVQLSHSLPLHSGRPPARPPADAEGDAAPSRELLNTGAIFRLKTGRNGVLRGSRRAFCGTSRLNRPAGITFGPDGSVFTTTFASSDGRRRIAKFMGPSAGAQAGKHCPDFLCPREEDDFHPWVRAPSPAASSLP